MTKKQTKEMLDELGFWMQVQLNPIPTSPTNYGKGYYDGKEDMVNHFNAYLAKLKVKYNIK